MSTHANPVSQVIPYLCIKGAAKAIDFYKQAFGATEPLARITDSTGRVGHAEIQIGGSTIMLADEHPELGFVSPQTLGGSHLQFMVTVPDADAMVGRAVAAGGTLTRPVENRFYGHRNGEITDPFGYRWTLSTRVEDVSEEELLRRAPVEEKKRKAGASSGDRSASRRGGAERGHDALNPLEPSLEDPHVDPAHSATRR